jgi:hypothetical protein
VDLTVRRGRTKTWNYGATVDGQPLNLTGATVYFTVKERYADLDEDALALKNTTEGGVTVTSAPGGTGTFRLDPADTLGLPDWETEVVWDLVVREANGAVHEIDSGKILVLPTVLTEATG